MITCRKDPGHGELEECRLSKHLVRHYPGNKDSFFDLYFDEIPGLICRKCKEENRVYSPILEKDVVDYHASFIKTIEIFLAKKSSKPLPGIDFIKVKYKTDSHRNIFEDKKTAIEENSEPEDRKLGEIIEPTRGFESFVVPKSTEEEIRIALCHLKHRDTVFEKWNLKKTLQYYKYLGMNFYGPSGTGKTLAAEVFAKETDKKLLIVNYAELESKYVGETPKNIRHVFSQAKDSDCILFFDEADSFLSRRLTNLTQAADYAVNVTRSEMLMQLDRFDGIVIFATNLGQNYDSAFVRRIPIQIEFKMPELQERKKLWQMHIPVELPLGSSVKINDLAEESKDLSGADIRNAVIRAGFLALEEARSDQDARVHMKHLKKAILQILKNRKVINNPESQILGKTVDLDERVGKKGKSKN